MARRRKKADWMNWVTLILMLIVGIGVGGLFINGTFLSVVFLKYLPLIVHQVVGWGLVAGSILSFVMKIMK